MHYNTIFITEFFCIPLPQFCAQVGTSPTYWSFLVVDLKPYPTFKVFNNLIKLINHIYWFIDYTRLEKMKDLEHLKSWSKVKRWNEVKVKTLLKLKKPIAKQTKRASLLRAHAEIWPGFNLTVSSKWIRNMMYASNSQVVLRPHSSPPVLCKSGSVFPQLPWTLASGYIRRCWALADNKEGWQSRQEYFFSLSPVSCGSNSQIIVGLNYQLL